MKKFNLVLLLLTFSMGMFAQFTAISWVNFDNHPEDFDATPYEKRTVMAPMADFVVDVDMLDEIEMPDLWNKLEDMGYPAQNVDQMVVDDGELGDLYDLDSDGTLGSQFKCFWSADYLFCMLKMVDMNGQLDPAQTRWEICYQTTNPDRYEAGWEAAEDLATKNQQYCAFTELGAGKALLNETGITESARTIGATGQWGSALGAAGDYVYNWSVDGDGTVWAVVGWSFDTYLVSLSDPTDPESDLVGLDPAATEKISFDVQANGYPGDPATRMAWFWSSSENDGYALEYYNGYLMFDDTPFYGVSTQDIKTQDKFAYIYDNVLRLKGFDLPVDLEVYSIVGQKVMSAKDVTTLNVSDLDRGIYLVKVDGEKQAFKVMK